MSASLCCMFTAAIMRRVRCFVQSSPVQSAPVQSNALCQCESSDTFWQMGLLTTRLAQKRNARPHDDATSRGDPAPAAVCEVQGDEAKVWDAAERGICGLSAVLGRGEGESESEVWVRGDMWCEHLSELSMGMACVALRHCFFIAHLFFYALHYLGTLSLVRLFSFLSYSIYVIAVVYLGGWTVGWLVGI